MLTQDAEQDLEELYVYIAEHDQPENADYVLGKLESIFDSLAEMPERGRVVKELSSLGILEYRELYFKPYRIIYRMIDQSVYIYLIVDGRRNMQSLLEKRLLG